MCIHSNWSSCSHPDAGNIDGFINRCDGLIGVLADRSGKMGYQSNIWIRNEAAN